MEKLNRIHYQSRNIGFTIFRILLCFLIIRNTFSYFNYSNLFFGKEGIAPYEKYTLYLDRWGLSFFRLLFELGPPDFYLWFIIIIAFLFMLGIGKWFTGILLYFLLLNLGLRNNMVLDGSDDIILITLPFLIIGDSYKYVSYNLPKLGLEQTKTFGHLRNLAAIGFLLQICIVYFVTGMVKSNTDVWSNGTANYYILQLDEFEATKWNLLLANNAFFTKTTTYFTLAFEILFPFAILCKRTKYIWLSLGVVFHIGIWVFMKIDVFPWIMIATYFVFIKDNEYKHIFDKLKYFAVKKMLLKSIQFKRAQF